MTEACKSGNQAVLEQVRGALSGGRLRLVRQRLWCPVSAANFFEPSDHYEYLLRLEEEDGSLLTPSALLTMAESSGLAWLIDLHVLQRVVLFARNHGGVHGVNLSASTLNVLRQSVFRSLLSWLMSLRGGSQICVELTETSPIEDWHCAAHKVQLLRAAGALIALDDFGSGFHKNLEIIEIVRPDYVKLDMQLVRQFMAGSDLGVFMVEGVLNYSRILGFKVVAEGVEDEETALRLAKCGVSLLQGYHFMRPTICLA